MREFAALAFLLSNAFPAEPAQRLVVLTYTATIDPIPANAKQIDLWLPVAQDTDGQTVSSVKVNYPEGGSIGVEEKYGNKI